MAQERTANTAAPTETSAADGSSFPTRNEAMTSEVTPLGRGLFMHRAIGDRFELLYPTDVVCNISQAMEQRLLTEKIARVRAEDERDDLARECSRLGTLLAEKIGRIQTLENDLAFVTKATERANDQLRRRERVIKKLNANKKL